MQENMAFQVEVQIDLAFASQVDETNLQTVVAATLRFRDIPVGAAVTLVITDDEKVHQLNRQFRQVDAPTDVLAFPAASDPPFVDAPGQPLYLGDVIISHPRAVAQAAVTSHPLPTELALLAVHGTLHLLGLDHATPEEKATMWTAQEAILTELGLKLNTHA